MHGISDWEEQYDKIYRYCYFKVHNRELAEDITQETFLRFLERCGKQTETDKASSKEMASGKETVNLYDITHRENILPYLYTIARNLCIDVWRKQRTERLSGQFSEQLSEQFSEQLSEQFSDKAALQNSSYVEEDAVERISFRLAFLELEETERELLLLRYVNEVPVSAIGKLYGISRFAVYRRLRQAERKLRENLDRNEL